MYTRQMFIRDLEELILICEEQLNQRKQGIEGDGTIGQLSNDIIPECKILLQQAKLNQLPPKGKRWMHSAWHVIDGWNNKVISHMAEKILDLADNYEEKLGDILD